MDESVVEQDGAPDSEADALRPPDGFDPEVFGDLPDWGRERVVEWHRRRQATRHDYEIWLRSDLKRGTILGGLAVLLPSPLLPGAGLMAAVSMTALGALAGRWIVRKEFSPTFGALAFAAPIAVASMVLLSLGFLKLAEGGFMTAFVNIRLFLLWLTWASFGAFLALISERSRQERVPF
jgi:hypothetical protein